MEAARRPYARDPLDDYALEPGVAEKVTFQLMDREQARLDKDFKTADSIREQLEEHTDWDTVFITDVSDVAGARGPTTPPATSTTTAPATCARRFAIPCCKTAPTTPA